MDESNWLLEVLEAIPDGVVIADKNGVMLLVNRELERITGYERTEILGSTVEVLIPHDVVGRHEGHRLGYRANPHRRAMGHGMELSARRKDGSVFPVEISLAPAEVAGDTVVIATVRDVTLTRQLDSDLQAARQRVLLAEDHESIARDLHDTVIQRLFASGLSLQSVLAQVPDAAKAKIERVLDDHDDAIRELRTAIFGLASKRSAGRTIRVVVNDLVDESSRVLGFRPTLHFTGVLDTIDETVTAEAAAVAREALSNVARHAHANRVDVTLRHSDTSLVMTIADDGEGIPASHRLGSGLLNMHDRAERLGGACSITSNDNGGTTVRWQVPLGD